MSTAFGDIQLHMLAGTALSKPEDAENATLPRLIDKLISEMVDSSSE